MKQVCSIKDASEGRKEGRDELQREICQNSLQVVYCRFFAGVLQVLYKLFAGLLQLGSHTSTFSVILCHFYSISELSRTRIQTKLPHERLKLNLPADTACRE